MRADEAGLPEQPEVVLMCGVAGAGKTTYAKDLETKGYFRLSVDEEIWHRFGRYGVDYEPDQYEEHTEVARRALRGRLLSLVARVATSSSIPASGSGHDGRHTRS
ncbi:AAA family ATPase [Micromonospora chersina]|uniref:AAA family ATPase n=1 Tax=Micromonospora chersina TaxID=47854 RepID=UPI003716F6DC